MNFIHIDNGCIHCGKELVYLKENTAFACMVCGKPFQSNVSCPDGHFVCDGCHSLSARDMIFRYCLSTMLTNPVDMANSLMKNKSVKMHGPEHHFLVPAVLLAAYYNIKGEFKVKEVKLKIALERSASVPGGYCGTHGTCGAAIGSGIFISIITGSTPLAKEEWHLSNLMTSISLGVIANSGGPRCCKRDTFIAIAEAVKFLSNKFHTHLDIDKNIKCDFSEWNRQCLFSHCLFYNG
ncbi:MAG: SAM-dependent methyltransferase [Bacteroidales bacterium]|nr:SAM-dependent methyltransferase [Bacteroidales bacterium]MCF8454774.1 SAM-dependent methyltransferase [Bacteroidales bacterium]